MGNSYSFDKKEKILTIHKVPIDENGNCSYPWDKLMGKVKKIVIEGTVTLIPKRAFANCWNLTAVSIPSYVTKIEEEAFANCAELKTVFIPSSIKEISSSAFNNCCSLSSINVDENNLNYVSQNGVLFSKDFSFLIRFPSSREEKSYIIPSSVSSICEYAFNGCSNLTSLSIPKNVTSFAKCAFSNCHNLTSISLPETITSIEEEAFTTCYKLIDLAIPGECKVATNAFRNCFTLVIVNALKAEFGSFAVGDKNLQSLIENLLYYLNDCYDEIDLLSKLTTALKQFYDNLKVKESSVQSFKRLISLLLPLRYKIRDSGLEVQLNSIYKEINNDNIFENIDNNPSLLHYHKF